MAGSSARSGAARASASSASKFALEAITDTLRVELAPWGIAVVIIEPGAIATPIWGKGGAAVQALLSPEVLRLYGGVMAGMQAQVATRAMEPPEAVAAAVVRALTVPRPRDRYVVGRDARARLLLTRLPTRLRDWLIRRAVSTGAPLEERA